MLQQSEAFITPAVFCTIFSLFIFFFTFSGDAIFMELQIKDQNLNSFWWQKLCDWWVSIRSFVPWCQRNSIPNLISWLWNWLHSHEWMNEHRQMCSCRETEFCDFFFYSSQVSHFYNTKQHEPTACYMQWKCRILNISAIFTSLSVTGSPHLSFCHNASLCHSISWPPSRL